MPKSVIVFKTLVDTEELFIVYNHRPVYFSLCYVLFRRKRRAAIECRPLVVLSASIRARRRIQKWN